jgi:3-hydroxyisobutyrate dehydrogenase-like beta-hydroxyacid dehydrogenase
VSRRLRVGWIGLGAMGLPMASRLAHAGHDVRVCEHRDSRAVDAARRAGAEAAQTPRAVAEASEFVFTMVRDEAQTDEVVRGVEGALGGLAQGTTLVMMSTLTARFCVELAEMAAGHGVDVLDAPVSGGVPAARSGSLSIMVGGAPAVLERCRPLLAELGHHVFHLGDVGAGQQAKIVSNAIKTGILGLTTEGLALGVRAGLDLDALLGALRAGSACSHVVEEWEYYYRFKLDDCASGRHELLHKDLAFALELAEELGIDVPLIREAAAADLSRPVPETSMT